MQDDLQAWICANLRDEKESTGASDSSAAGLNERLSAVESCLGVLNAVWPDGTTEADHSPGHTAESAPTSTVDTLLSSGQDRIGRFVLRKRLGAGGMGTVFLAEDVTLGRDVAIKIPLWHASNSDAAIRRFRREAETTARLRHPNVVGIHESGTDLGLQFIVSEFINGPDLREWLADSEQAVSADSAARCVEQLADGIHAAHNCGILHRDLKPANVMLEPRGQQRECTSLDDYIPRVTDFGLARDTLDEIELTDPGVTLGTSSYSAPEQAAGRLHELGPSSDVFSLGTILYQLLTGESPFRRSTVAATTLSVINDDPPPAHQICADVPRDLSAICEKCLQKSSRKRYQTAAELRDDLRRYRERVPTLARPVSRWEQLARWARRAPYKASLLTVSAVFAIAVAAGLGLHLRELRNHRNELSNTIRQVDAARNRATKLLKDSQRFQKLAEFRAQEARQLAYDSELRLAFDHLNRGNLVSAEQLTQELVSSPAKDIAWQLLSLEVQARLQLLGQHDGPVNGVSVLPQRREVVSVGTDGFVRVWSLHPPSLNRETQLPGGELNAVRATPDGRQLAVSGRQQGTDVVCVYLLNTDTLAIDETLMLPGNTAQSLDWSPYGNTLAVGRRYDGVILWDRTTREQVQMPGERRNESVRFFQDAQQLLIADESGLQLRSTTEPYDVIRRFSLPDRNTGFALSADQTQIAVKHSDDPDVQLLSANDKWATAISLPTQLRKIDLLGVCPLSGSVAGASPRGLIQIWLLGDTHSVASERPRHHEGSVVEQVHSGPCLCLEWTEDGTLVTGGEDGLVRLYGPGRTSWQPVASLTGNVVDAIPGPEDVVYVLDAKGVASAVRAGSHSEPWTVECEFFEVSEGTAAPQAPSAIWQFAVSRRAREDEKWLALSGSGTHLAVVSDHNRISVFNTHTARKITHVESTFNESDEGEWFTTVALSPDGSLLAAGDTQRRLLIWQLPQGRLLHQKEYTDSVEAVCFASSGDAVLVGGRFEQLELLSLPKPEVRWSREVGDGMWHARSFADGRQLMTGHQDGTIRIWETETGSMLHVLSGHQHGITDLALLHNEELAASVDNVGNIRLWNLRRNRPVGQLLNVQHFGYKVERLIPRPDGRGLAAVVKMGTFGQNRLFAIDLPVE